MMYQVYNRYINYIPAFLLPTPPMVAARHSVFYESIKTFNILTILIQVIKYY